MVLAEAVTHKGFENPLRLNLSNPVDSDKSGEHEICSSIHDRFRIVSVALTSQALAVLRPRFPIKPTPPFRGDMIVIGDDLLQDTPKKAPASVPR